MCQLCHLKCFLSSKALPGREAKSKNTNANEELIDVSLTPPALISISIYCVVTACPFLGIASGFPLLSLSPTPRFFYLIS